MLKQTKAQVKAAIRRQGVWRGYLVPCRVAPCHIRAGWCLGAHVTFDSLADLAVQVNAYAYYNCNAELGRYVAFYQEDHA